MSDNPLMACPDCGEHKVVAEMRSVDTVPVHAIEGSVALVFIDFTSTEWEVEDAYCDGCGWSASHHVSEYEWVGDYPPKSEPAS